MANTNTFTVNDVIPRLLAQGLMALRENAIMPRYVTREYESMAGEKGSTIDVNIPSAVSASSVTHNVTHPDDTGSDPSKVAIALDKWYEAAFFMSDKDMLEVMSGYIPMQASEAVKALANQVDSDILALYTQVYGWGGTAGTTPFATDLTEFLDADTALNNQLAPMEPRTVVLNAKATGQAKGLRAIQDASWRADPTAMKRNDLGYILGYDWAMDQNIPTHTAGTASGVLAAALGVIGNKTIAVDTGSGTAVVGDIITFADHTQTYTITAASADVSTGTLAFEPGLVTAVPDTTAITFKAAHKVNLAFHRDWAALVSRPFAASDPLGLGTFQSAVDPVSGLALRLEVSRLYKRTRFSYDLLYGTQVIRKEFAARIAGE